MERVKIGGILQAKGLASISVTGIPDRAGVASRIFGTMGNHRINVEFIVHTVDDRARSHVSFCVDRKDLREAISLLERQKEKIGYTEIMSNRQVGLISIFGPHFRERPGIAGAFFHALGTTSINILAISTSVSTCSCLIAEEDMSAAVASLSQAFALPGG